MRPEIVAAAAEVAKNNPWYTSDQFANQTHGVYRLSMKLRFAYFRKQLESFNLNGKTVVDLGCGDGQWSAELSKCADVRLIGVDYNQLRLDRYGQNLPGADTRFGSCLEIPIESHSVDAVMFHQVLEHLSEPRLALREILRILNADGLLILSVPNEGTWLKQQIQYKFIQPNALKTSDHVNFYTRHSLKILLEATGFSVPQVDSLGFYFPHNGLSRRIVGNEFSFRVGLALSRVFPTLRDCLFAWCRPATRK